MLQALIAVLMVVTSQGAICLEIGKLNGRMDQVSEKLDQI
jgi:hypothetical protein